MICTMGDRPRFKSSRISPASSIHLSDSRIKIKHICLHPSIFFIHLPCTLPSFELLPILLNTLAVSNLPFREWLSKCMCRDNMFPFYSICPFMILLRNVSTGEQVWFLTFEGTSTVESNRIILIQLPEKLLRLGEWCYLGVLWECLGRKKKDWDDDE